MLHVCLLDATFKVWTDGLPLRKTEQMSAALVFCQYALCGSVLAGLLFRPVFATKMSHVPKCREQTQWLGLRLLLGAMPVPGELQLMHSPPRQLETFKIFGFLTIFPFTIPYFYFILVRLVLFVAC